MNRTQHKSLVLPPPIMCALLSLVTFFNLSTNQSKLQNLESFVKFIKSQPKCQNTINSSISKRKPKPLFPLVTKWSGWVLGILIAFNVFFQHNVEVVRLIPLVNVLIQAPETKKSSTDNHSDNDPRGN
ncbi:hypothetical protein ANA_P30017 (plasmid) [Anabaena sp. 90]|nr:hypothetical protein ANA_P30017 [Anabaena sp. 90]